MYIIVCGLDITITIGHYILLLINRRQTLRFLLKNYNIYLLQKYKN